MNLPLLFYSLLKCMPDSKISDVTRAAMFGITTRNNDRNGNLWIFSRSICNEKNDLSFFPHLENLIPVLPATSKATF